MSLEKLRQEGWNIDSLKLENLLADDYDENMGPQELKDILLDQDIREWGDAIINKRKEETTFKGPVILQLNKWRNVNKPKMSDHMENDGICILSFTDGAGGTIKGLQDENTRLENIRCVFHYFLNIIFSGNTPAGSKVLLTGTIKIERDFLMLTRQNCKLLGGYVEKLVEKWKAERFSGTNNIRKLDTNVPKWIPFEKRSTGKANTKPEVKIETKTFKAMSAVGPKDKPKEENEGTTQFDEARKTAIENIKKEQAEKKRETENRKPNKPIPIAVTKRDETQQEIQKPPEKSQDLETDTNEENTNMNQGKSNFYEERRRRSARYSAPREFTNSNFGRKNKQEQQTSTFGDFLPDYPNLVPTTTSNSNFPASSNATPKIFLHRNPPIHRNHAYQKDNESPMKNGNDYRDQPRESAPKSRNKYQKTQTSTTGNDYQHPPREPVPKSRNNYQKPQTSKTGNDYQHPPRESVPKSRNNYQKPQTSPGNDYQQQHREPALKNRNKYQESQTSTTSQASNKTPLPPVPKPVQKQPPPTPQPVLVSIGANNVVDGAYVLAPWFDNKHYPAQVISLGPADLCTVRYTEYGNTSMVPRGSLLMQEFVRTA